LATIDGSGEMETAVMSTESELGSYIETFKCSIADSFRSLIVLARRIRFDRPIFRSSSIG